MNEFGSYLLNNNDKKLYNKLSVDTSFGNTDRSANQRKSNYKTHNKIFGDAIWETSHAEETINGVSYYTSSWNGDSLAYPFSERDFENCGGNMTSGINAGVFSMNSGYGCLDSFVSFRACVINAD